MIDEIRTATTLAATLTRSPATLDASAFDAALVAARDQRARLDEPFLAPRRPADATDRSTGAPVARNDSAPSGGTGEQAGSRPAADEGNRPATDPQAQVLAARQDAAAASDRTLRNRRLAERSAQAQASQQQAQPTFWGSSHVKNRKVKGGQTRHA